LNSRHFYNNCSESYIGSISSVLHSELCDSVSALPKRRTQAEVNRDLWWLLTAKGWCYDSAPAGLPEAPPRDLGLADMEKRDQVRMQDRDICRSATTVEADWRVDFAKAFGGKLVHLEVQFGKVESMFKDFCGFQIAWREGRIALGVSVVMCDPGKYFAHRVRAVSGMAYFSVAASTLPTIGLDCPIWVVGIEQGASFGTP
jgi:hypothetical protein